VSILQEYQQHQNIIPYQQHYDNIPTPEGYGSKHWAIHQDQHQLATTTKQINETYGQKIFHNAIFVYSSRTTSAWQWYQPGGTMISSTGTIASQHLETGNDASGMGRFSHHKITGANGHKIIFIAAYWVCKDSIMST
jgi:hypothetical protein